MADEKASVPGLEKIAGVQDILDQNKCATQLCRPFAWCGCNQRGLTTGRQAGC